MLVIGLSRKPWIRRPSYQGRGRFNRTQIRRFSPFLSSDSHPPHSLLSLQRRVFLFRIPSPLCVPRQPVDFRWCSVSVYFPQAYNHKLISLVGSRVCRVKYSWRSVTDGLDGDEKSVQLNARSSEDVPGIQGHIFPNGSANVRPFFFRRLPQFDLTNPQQRATFSNLTQNAEPKEKTDGGYVGTMSVRTRGTNSASRAR